jgi:predicted SnoaL-like aldol condensation-catalyzing enzyme
MASTATLALNSGEWFLRGLLLMVILLSRASGPRCCRRVSTYRCVQICGATSPEENRKNAMAFYDLMFNQCKPREAVERYVGASDTQHNPHVADGTADFIEYFERVEREYPGKQVFFKRSVAEHNLVVLHCHQIWPTDGNRDCADIDIFRFDDDGKIVEHWDVLQVVPSDAKHSNTMF